jgi:NADH-quinone oxidoreductase subunit N
MNSMFIKDIAGSAYGIMVPEIYLCVTTLVLLIYGVYRSPKASKGMAMIAMLLLALTAWLLVCSLSGSITGLNGMVISDPFALIAKLLILGSGIMALLLSIDWLMEEGGRPFEFIILLMFATLGMILMVSANNFLSMYMALEMSSLALYVLASFSRDSTKSTEAGLKYFVLGALASGMMLYGMSLVYGFAGTTNFTELAALFSTDGDVSKGVIVGMILIMVGLCFKVSAVPFHMWTPDVYEGAPTPVTAFFSTAPKVAALLLFTRLMIEPFGHLAEQWQQIIIFVSVASMLVGSLGGLMQTNIKRLLAYSSIGHVGFILMGLAAGGVAGVQSILVYITLYIAMSVGAFACVLLMKRDGVYLEDIKELSGLAQTQPGKALILSVFMFSMAGIPPLAGFFGKMYVVIAAVAAGLWWLAAIGVLFSVISGYYYIKIVKVMYFDEATSPLDTKVSVSLRIALFISLVVTTLFFLIPTPLVTTAHQVAEAFLK